MSVENQDVQEEQKPAPKTWWDAIVWPEWLPIRARRPMVAQLTAAMALVAALTMPQWSDVQPDAPAPAATPSIPVAASPDTPQTVIVPLGQNAEPQPETVMEPSRPAHLNLDVRHTFRSVTFSVVVDDKRVLEEKLDGSRKRFGAFGKRTEKGFTKTLDLEPGVRVVRVRVRSAADKFDQTRVERFELGSASVASMRIAVDKNGLSIFSDRPAPPPFVTQAALSAMQLQVGQAAPPSAASQPAPSAAEDLYQALRSMLIAVTGFVASTATAFLVQEFLRQKKRVLGL